MDYLDVAVQNAKALRARQQTHWIEYDAEKLGRRGNEQARAVCGYLVPLAAFSTKPTCADCLAALRDDAATMAALGIAAV